MQELRNLRKLHTAQHVRIEKLETLVRDLKQENALLREENTTLKLAQDDMKLQLEELRTIVFGKKRKKNDDDDLLAPPPAPKTPVIRDTASYQRPVPSAEEITNTEHHTIALCGDCQSQLAKKRLREYFVEDIPLPQKKIVTKHLVTQVYCTACAAWKSPLVLPSARVALGENVRRLVTYLSVVNRQSYQQIQDLLKDTYSFSISEGEIAKILTQEGEGFRPTYERLLASIRGEPSVHLDETGWNLQKGDGIKRYAWTMTGGQSSESIFLLGKSRGHGNAEDLLGDSTAVIVTDDYSAYWNLGFIQQLCLAHILRKLRDLATAKDVTEEIRLHCTKAYALFAGIYTDIEIARTSADPESQYESLFKRLTEFALSHSEDPKKLAKVRIQVRERTARYLTCLKYRGVASDNNAAERSLRHLVIKRKTSFGSFSERTAETLAVLTSVLMSYRRKGTLGNWLVGAGV
jgi:transposase